MAFTPQQEKQIELVLAQLSSALHKISIESKKMRPHAQLVIGNAAPVSGIIPSGTKAFNIINLGLNGLNVTRADIPVAGIVGITFISAMVDTFEYSIENDQDIMIGAITVTPPIDHHVLLQYIIQEL